MKSSNKLPLLKQKEIAERLKSLRSVAGYTQKDIAQKMGITEKTYRKWEVGIYNRKTNIEYYPAIEYDNLFTLAEIYHVSIDYLLCRSNCTSVDNHYISLKTGLSEPAITYLREKSNSKHYTDVLNILLKTGNFDNALWHIGKYMEAVYLHEGLTKIRHERKEKIITESIQNHGDLQSYNYPYNDSLESKIKEVETQMDVEELRIDQNFKFIIHEVARIAAQRTE